MAHSIFGEKPQVSINKLDREEIEDLEKVYSDMYVEKYSFTFTARNTKFGPSCYLDWTAGITRAGDGLIAVDIGWPELNEMYHGIQE